MSKRTKKSGVFARLRARYLNRERERIRGLMRDLRRTTPTKQPHNHKKRILKRHFWEVSAQRFQIGWLQSTTPPPKVRLGDIFKVGNFTLPISRKMVSEHVIRNIVNDHEIELEHAIDLGNQPLYVINFDFSKEKKAADV